mgnify:FL=1|tara:strand:- start:288 stop:905 length:618 start_codon:yes stop_codon:yes gene_type:complete
MSVSSLTKFTVPIDGDQSAASQGLLMPKLKYRFRASFENFGVSTPRTEMTKQIMNITRPAVTFEENMIDIYNSKVYLVGKHTWDPITVNLRDDVNGAVSKLAGEQVQKQFDFMEQSSAASGIDYKFITRFEILDGGNGANTPNVLETWELYGCFIQNVNYNELDYASQDPANITMSIRFDNAVQTPLGEGIGSSVARTVGQVVTG